MWEICDVEDNVLTYHKHKYEKLSSVIGELGLKMKSVPHTTKMSSRCTADNIKLSLAQPYQEHLQKYSNLTI